MCRNVLSYLVCEKDVLLYKNDRSLAWNTVLSDLHTFLCPLLQGLIILCFLISRKTHSTLNRTKQVQKPIMIYHYNKNMGGVDLTDQCQSYLSDIANRPRRGYQCMLYFCLQQSVVNARRLYLNYHMGQNLPIGKLLEKLITAMMKEIHNELATAPQASVATPASSLVSDELILSKTPTCLQPGCHFPQKQVSYEY